MEQEINLRDLVIELRTEVRSIRDDIKDLKEGTTERIICLEKEKADRKEVELIQEKLNKDHEIRLRQMESKVVWVFAFSSGAGAVLGVVINYFMKNI